MEAVRERPRLRPLPSIGFANPMLGRGRKRGSIHDSRKSRPTIEMLVWE
jgi:hypothetical protein